METLKTSEDVSQFLDEVDVSLSLEAICTEIHKRVKQLEALESKHINIEEGELELKFLKAQLYAVQVWDSTIGLPGYMPEMHKLAVIAFYDTMMCLDDWIDATCEEWGVEAEYTLH